MSSEKDMSLLDHIGDLRGHLIRIIIAIVIGAAVVGYFLDEVFDKILLAPMKNDFYSIQLVNKFFDSIGLSSSKFEYSEKFILQTKELTEFFNLSIQVAIYGGIILMFPYIIYEIWKFIAPALKPNEKKNSVFYITFTVISFFIGGLFGYYLISPIAIQFFINYTPSALVEKQIVISSVVSMILSSTIGMAIVFLFPVFTYALTAAGILTPMFLKEYRKHAFVVILTVAAFITPADFISMFVAAIPLWFLYEISIIISTVVYKKAQKRQLS